MKTCITTEIPEISGVRYIKSTEACDTALSGADPKLLGCWSVCGNSAEQEFQKYTDKQDKSSLEAGFMWQKLHRTSEKYGLQSEICLL